MVNEIDRDKVAKVVEKIRSAEHDPDLEVHFALNDIVYKLDSTRPDALVAIAEVMRRNADWLRKADYPIPAMVRSALADALELMAEHKRRQAPAKAAEEATA